MNASVNTSIANFLIGLLGSKSIDQLATLVLGIVNALKQLVRLDTDWENGNSQNGQLASVSRERPPSASDSLSGKLRCERVTVISEFINFSTNN